MVTLGSTPRAQGADQAGGRLARRAVGASLAVATGAILGASMANQGAAILRTALVVGLVIALTRRLRAR